MSAKAIKSLKLSNLPHRAYGNLGGIIEVQLE
jgi:hypothetical protein